MESCMYSCRVITVAQLYIVTEKNEFSSSSVFVVVDPFPVYNYQIGRVYYQHPIDISFYNKLCHTMYMYMYVHV